MKSYSLQPTDENILESFCKDSIGRNQHVFRFIQLLNAIQDECCTIAINGEWGSGKTFFVKQAKLILDMLNPQTIVSEDIRNKIQSYLPDEVKAANSLVSVYYDAWINDNHDDPILSLIYSTIASRQSDFTVEKKRSLLSGAAALAGALTGRDIKTVFEECCGDDVLKPLRDSDNIRTLVKEFIGNLIEERGNRLVLFIDELDRCKPDYAIRFLERIKHYFDDNRVTFVFSVSLSQLQAIVKTYYGTDFGATRYLDKFFDLRLSLPGPSLEHYMRNRLEVYQDTILDYTCIGTAQYFNFSLREVERYVRLIKIAIKPGFTEMMDSRPEMQALRFSVSYIFPVMVGLQMTDINKYLEFVAGNDPGPLSDILSMPNIGLMQNPPINIHEEEYDAEAQIIKNRRTPEDTITPAERLISIYRALFSEAFDVHNYRTVIANMRFTAETRQAVKEMVALLAPCSNYNI